MPILNGTHSIPFWLQAHHKSTVSVLVSITPILHSTDSIPFWLQAHHKSKPLCLYPSRRFYTALTQYHSVSITRNLRSTNSMLLMTCTTTRLIHFLFPFLCSFKTTKFFHSQFVIICVSCRLTKRTSPAGKVIIYILDCCSKYGRAHFLHITLCCFCVNALQLHTPSISLTVCTPTHRP
jgi:hypothetical protein